MRQINFVRWFYTLSLYLLIPLIILRLLWRGLRAPAYWQRWSERFGFISSLPPHSLWIHAVSMGEVQAAIPLIQTLSNRFPHHPILVTTMTPTGSQRVKAVFAEQVWHVYLPYDLPDAVARFLKRTQPQLLILLETELWPNLLQACQQRLIPVILVNARLSAQSSAKYQRIAGFMRQILTSLVAIAAQTQVDANRFIELGVPATQIQVTGNIKFDSRSPAHYATQAKQLRHQCGNQRVIWIAASTHEGEEKLVLEAFSRLKAEIKALLLILVPRHPERFNRVALLCQQHGYLVSRRSQNQPCTAITDIYLGDTMGELPLLYAASDVAFVGGSLVPIGGHNLLEPAAAGLPIIVGTYVFECEEICRQLLAEQAGQQVHNTEQLVQAAKRYLIDAHLRQQAGEQGRWFVEKNQGALERVLSMIYAYIK
ncbi:3-deoxy-D-manno-octulosonic-acid transferase domain-containing protein [Thioploca ingrica]|uniref:3-deoxy-D-manno-octulosonic acid transferase n=1 Tax=Thioploca ingrica TaxID=40754 RepID=A0A090BVJ9_9GAMM|nr:3-deoxy-D-manno-octulosonic-acid transferase domain-containing protein [Thioploca ingrica]